MVDALELDLGLSLVLACELVVDIFVDYTTEECRVPIARSSESRTDLGEPLNVI